MNGHLSHLSPHKTQFYPNGQFCGTKCHLVRKTINSRGENEWEESYRTFDTLTASVRHVPEAFTGQMVVRAFNQLTATHDGQWLTGPHLSFSFLTFLTSSNSMKNKCNECLNVPCPTDPVFHAFFFLSQKLPLQQIRRLNPAPPELGSLYTFICIYIAVLGGRVECGEGERDLSTRMCSYFTFPNLESTHLCRLPNPAMQ